MKTIAELETAIEEREVTVMIHMGICPPSWIVWIYAPEDPDIRATGKGLDLATAFDAALSEWGPIEDDDVDPPSGGEGPN